MRIPVSQLLDVKKGNSLEFNRVWMHPDLAIQLAQWVLSKFALQVSEWIRNLFINGKVEINIKLLVEIKSKDERIKIFKKISNKCNLYVNN